MVGKKSLVVSLLLLGGSLNSAERPKPARPQLRQTSRHDRSRSSLSCTLPDTSSRVESMEEVGLKDFGGVLRTHPSLKVLLFQLSRLSEASSNCHLESPLYEE